jgi:glycosyltransferase involved in cell wall biosynthesis
MRIVQACPWFHPHTGGVESHVRALAKGLVARGHDVTVLTTNHARLPEEARVDGVRVLRVKPRAVWMRTPITPRTKGALRSLAADVVHAHSPPPLTAYYAAKATKGRGLPFVVTYHCDLDLPRPVGPLVVEAYRRTYGAATLRRTDRVIVTTRTYGATSRSVWRQALRVIPNAVDTTVFSPDVDGSAVRRRHGIREDVPLVLMVGRMVAHKGIEHLLASARHVPRARYVVVGSGPFLPAAKALAESLGVRDRVVFPGHVPRRDLPAYYAACDVFALPSVSRLEAFGIVALEAMATAKPVVVSDIPGVREVIEDGREGLLCDPLNPEDLAAKIRTLLEDETLGREMGARGRRRVLEEFSLDRVVGAVEAVYEEVMAG